MARLFAIGAILLLAGQLAVNAQQRSAPATPRPSPTAPVRSTPASDSRFTSTLVFRGHPTPSTTLTPFRGLGRSVVFPGIPFLWYSGVPALYLDTPLPLQPLPRDAPKGGVQLAITPWRASVYVDGMLAGHVEEFRGYYQHLELAAGPHEIAIVEPGYQPLIFVVTVIPGRTLMYSGTLTDGLTF